MRKKLETMLAFTHCIQPVCSLTFSEPLTLINTQKHTHTHKGKRGSELGCVCKQQAKQTTHYRSYNITFTCAYTQTSEQLLVKNHKIK